MPNFYSNPQLGQLKDTAPHCNKPPACTHMRLVPHSSCPASRLWLPGQIQKAPTDTIHTRRLCCHSAHRSPRSSIRRHHTRRSLCSLPGRRRALGRSRCSLDRMRTSRHRGRLCHNCEKRSRPHTPRTRFRRFAGTRGCTCSRAPGWRLRGTGRWLGRLYIPQTQLYLCMCQRDKQCSFRPGRDKQHKCPARLCSNTALRHWRFSI